MDKIFDTLAAARDLEAAGIERKQAEKIAETILNGQGDSATKADIAGVKTELFAVKSELKIELSALKWLVGFMFALLIAVAARVFQLL